MESNSEVVELNIRSPKKRLYLVTGGCGFIGSHLVRKLLQLGYRVRILDKVKQNSEQLPNGLESFVYGDIRNLEDCLLACNDVDCVFHMATMTELWGPPHLYQEVNVGGTENIIKACKQCNVAQLIYTSSSSVVMDGQDCQDGDETMSYPTRHLDTFSYSVCRAEQKIIAANGNKTKDGLHRLLTCVLRPHFVFGPGDSHFMAQIIQKAKHGQLTHIIGEGHNLGDFTYIDNVVYAHVLASSKLSSCTAAQGQVYFVTNGEPIMFWSFIIKTMTMLGYSTPTKHISFNVAYVVACLMEFFYWLTGWLFGWKPVITRYMVVTMGCHQYFSHAKATQDLGYRPIVTLDEGIQRTVEYFSKKDKILRKYKSKEQVLIDQKQPDDR